MRRELPPEDRPALIRLATPRREAELLAQLLQLVAALDGAWRRAAAVGATWRRLQEARQLRSRQRATWSRMQSALPELRRLTSGGAPDGRGGHRHEPGSRRRRQFRRESHSVFQPVCEWSVFR